MSNMSTRAPLEQMRKYTKRQSNHLRLIKVHVNVIFSRIYGKMVCQTLSHFPPVMQGWSNKYFRSSFPLTGCPQPRSLPWRIFVQHQGFLCSLSDGNLPYQSFADMNSLGIVYLPRYFLLMTKSHLYNAMREPTNSIPGSRYWFTDFNHPPRTLVLPQVRLNTPGCATNAALYSIVLPHLALLIIMFFTSTICIYIETYQQRVDPSTFQRERSNLTFDSRTAPHSLLQDNTLYCVHKTMPIIVSHLIPEPF